MTTKPPTPMLTCLYGSNFSAKAMTAFLYKQVPHDRKVIRATELRKLPAPHTCPTLDVGDVHLGDSTDILKWLDKVEPNRPLYPEEQRADVEKLEDYIDEVVINFVQYIRWTSDEGFDRIMRPVISKLIPKPVQCLCCCCLSVDAVAKSSRAKFKERYIKTCHPVMNCEGDKMDVKNAYEGLFQELIKFNTRLANAKPSATYKGARFLCSTDGPSAADFACYGALNPAVGTTGDANIEAVRAEWLQDAKLTHYAQWYQWMSRFPIRFKTVPPLDNYAEQQPAQQPQQPQQQQQQQQPQSTSPSQV